MTNIVLRLDNISKDFFGNKVLNNISFCIKKGEIIGLVGENGAGKSTLMKILFGMPVINQTGGYNGKILIEEKEVNFKSPFDALKHGIAMVHQEFSLIPNFTAIENISLNTEVLNHNILSKCFGKNIACLNRSQMKIKAENAVKKLGINIELNTIMQNMPVGDKQFTEIAREIARDGTKILILDEPSAVLTETETEILIKVLQKLSEEGITIIFISHRLQEIINLTHKILVLRDGNLIKEVDTKDANIKKIAEWMVGRDIEENNKTIKKELENNKNIIEIKNLAVNMPGEKVKNVSFNLKQGEILGLGGLAGQGKLGVLNGIMGLFETTGSIKIYDKEIELNNPKKILTKDIAFVSEDRKHTGLVLDESIEWNITFTAMQIQNKFLKNYGFIKIKNNKMINDISNKYKQDLSIKCTSLKQKVGELSGGNQQKVCLARAFVLNPKIILVSEPTRGIDIGAKKLVLDTLKKINEENGTSIIIVSSELEELRSICNRIAIINNGVIAGILDATTEATQFALLMLGENL